MSEPQDKSATTIPRIDKGALRLAMARDLEAKFLADGSAMEGIGHLLVVAGASGAGKSTFVSQFVTGQLAAATQAHLPVGAQNWIRLRVGGFNDWLPALLDSVRQDEIPGAILDYDMVGRGILDGYDYADDPLLHLMKIAKNITVVNIRPPVKKIVSQLVERENAYIRRHTRAGKIGRTVAYVLSYIRNSLTKFMPAGWTFYIEKTTERTLPKGVVVRARGFFDSVRKPSVRRDPEKRREQLQRKVSRYKRSGWLNNIYRKWESYLRSLARGGVSIKQIFVEPKPGCNKSIDWLVTAVQPCAEVPRPNIAAEQRFTL